LVIAQQGHWGLAESRPPRAQASLREYLSTYDFTICLVVSQIARVAWDGGWMKPDETGPRKPVHGEMKILERF
jgi:hypothetical protein